MIGIADFNLFFKICDIFGFAGGISDEMEKFRTKACYDGIVDYASSNWLKEAGKGRLASLEGRCR